MTVGILTEKNSAARNFAKALGGARGTYNGEDYVIVASRGHIYEFVDPSEMVEGAYSDTIKKWSLEGLPWDYTKFSWVRKKSAADVVSKITKELKGVDEIVIATDVDPTGEGDLLAWEILLEGNLTIGKKVSRMFFTDEAESSLQQAFKDRKTISADAMDDPNYRKAFYRTKFDMLSMQWTRAATIIARNNGFEAALRNGRLKSAMTVIVGDQLKAIDEYEPVPSYQVRFQDDHGVVYTNPDEAMHKEKDQAPVGDFTSSDVVTDKTERKHTAPPKLLDLSALSSALSSKGVAAKKVLEVYQKMYEAQIVSYPRTEDKNITTEQFNDLKKDIDKIAAVVGVDAARLTHRTPRKTHVKDSGAHGANRPGPNVPASLDALESSYGPVGRQIYEILAKSALRMFAEDYEYDRITGHVKDYPDFVGGISVPVEQGWKGIFNDDVADEETDDDDDVTTLGSTAEPYVAEIIPPKPAQPTMKWLMKQLDKENVGTGATRTSTYSDVTSGKLAQLADKKGKISMTTAGEVNYLLLPGTAIGSTQLTKDVYDYMQQIADGELTAEVALAKVAGLIEADITTMKDNASTIDAGLRKKMAEATGGSGKERVEGTYAPTGDNVRFSREWSGYRFTDEEVEKLLAGEGFEITAKSKRTKKLFTVYGELAYQTSVIGGEEISFWGFKPDFERGNYTGVHKPSGAQVSFSPKIFNNDDIPPITEEESKILLEGGTIERPGLTSKKGNTYDGKFALTNEEYNGNTNWRVGLVFDDKKKKK